MPANTGYYMPDGRDLGTILVSGNAGISTGLLMYEGVDLGTFFAKATYKRLTPKTKLIASNGRDLVDVFETGGEFDYAPCTLSTGTVTPATYHWWYSHSEDVGDHSHTYTDLVTGYREVSVSDASKALTLYSPSDEWSNQIMYIVVGTPPEAVGMDFSYRVYVGPQEGSRGYDVTDAQVVEGSGTAPAKIALSTYRKKKDGRMVLSQYRRNGTTYRAEITYQRKIKL